MTAADALVVERLDGAALLNGTAAWRDLLSRAAEPNVFLHPGFVTPAVHHLYERRVGFVVVREGGGRWLALLPLVLPPPGRRGGIARLPLHEQAALGTPLLDAAAAPAVWAAVRLWLHRHHPYIVALLLPRLDADGATCASLRAAAVAAGGALSLMDLHARAVLPRRLHDARLSPKRVKELRRQERRLAGDGILTYVSAETPADVAAATETFLVLEGRGWKGLRRTALMSQPALAAFTRAMTRALALDGSCRIDSLCRDGVPVAMGIVLRAGGAAAFWKTAYDENLARLSPGVQLTLRLTEHQLDDATVVRTDSCAVADHPMIDRLWPARMTVADVALPLRPADDVDLLRALRREAARRAVRRFLKGAVLRLRAVFRR